MWASIRGDDDGTVRRTPQHQIFTEQSDGNGILGQIRRVDHRVPTVFQRCMMDEVGHQAPFPRWSDQLTTCADPRLGLVSESTASREDPKPIATIARSYLDAFSRADPDEIADHVSRDFINEHTAALGSGCKGKDAYRQRLPGFLGDMVSLRYEVEGILVEGDDAAAFYTMKAKWQGDAPISVRGVMRLRAADGLLTHRTDYWDSAVFLTQVSNEAREALAPFGVTTS